jgi:hypothetical protein
MGEGRSRRFIGASGHRRKPESDLENGPIIGRAGEAEIASMQPGQLARQV